MTNKHLSNWIMYHEIQKLERFGFKKSKIAHYLGLDVRTVSKYLNMTEDGYENHLLQNQQRSKILSPYENFVAEKLSRFTDTSAAQIHDWLKEHHPDFPEINPRTVYNFVMFVRQKHNIPHVKMAREYFPIQELPYGEQAQVDFGEYNMRMACGARKKVKFFAMVLSRSRMKFVWFLDKPFTGETVCLAHEHAFAFFEGIPLVLVFDQDRTMVVDENIGDIILTNTFKQYTASRSFKLHFCRKADPESKGKVENIVQYVKKNFLYNRLYSDIDTLNTEALAWLGRTANHLPHNYTKKSPHSEFIIEQKHLKSYTPIPIENKEVKMHHVRKTNVIAYKSNFYTVPMGTYRGSDSKVVVKEKENVLEIYNLKEELICSHQLCLEKGQTIANTNHKRDTSESIEKLMKQVIESFTDQVVAKKYLQQIKERLPRYVRDHLSAILKALKEDKKPAADKTLDWCIQNQIYNGNEFNQVYQVLFMEKDRKKTSSKEKNTVKTLGKGSLDNVDQVPQKSDIEVYENIINT